LDDHGRARLARELGAVRDGILLPLMQQGIEGGFSTPPEETEIDVYKIMP
jgi:hypothetical protein